MLGRRQLRSLTGGLATVPNSAADVTTSTTRVYQVVMVNKTAGQVTLTVTDKASPAKTLIPGITLDANSLAVANFAEGVQMNGGVRWTAGAADSIDADVVGEVNG